MSELLAEQIKSDVGGFESRFAVLRGRRETLLQEIDEVDKDIKTIEPLYTYAKGLLDRLSKQPSRTAAATAASAAARRAKKEKEAGATNPN